MAAGPDTPEPLGNEPEIASAGWLFASVQLGRHEAESKMQMDVRAHRVVVMVGVALRPTYRAGDSRKRRRHIDEGTYQRSQKCHRDNKDDGFEAG